jgi:hypothetical protein
MQKADRATVRKSEKLVALPAVIASDGIYPARCQVRSSSIRVVGDAFEDVTQITFLIDVSMAMPIRG